MSKEEREFLDALRKRSIEASAEILEGVQRLKSMYEEITDDGSGEPMPKPRLGDHFYQLAKFELEHASTLIRLGNSQAEMVFDHLRHLARRTQKATTPVLELVPDDKGTSRARFEIKNPFDKPGDLRFEIEALRDASGMAVPNRTLRVVGKGGASSIRAHDTLYLDVSAETPEATLFGDVKVYLLADIEKQISHRVIKVRAAAAAPAAAVASRAAAPGAGGPKAAPSLKAAAPPKAAVVRDIGSGRRHKGKKGKKK